MRATIVIFIVLALIASAVLASRTFSITGNAGGNDGHAVLDNASEEDVAALAEDIAKAADISVFLKKMGFNSAAEAAEAELEEEEEEEEAQTMKFKRLRTKNTTPAAKAFQRAGSKISKSVKAFHTNLKKGASKLFRSVGSAISGRQGSGNRGATAATKAGRIPTQAEIDDEIAVYGSAELPNNKCITACSWFLLPGGGLSIGTNQDQICARCRKDYIIYDGPCYAFPDAFQNGQITGANAEGVKKACAAVGSCTCTKTEINESNVKTIKFKPKGVKRVIVAIGKVFKAAAKAVKKVAKVVGKAVKKVGKAIKRLFRF